jgi:nitrogen fixation protein FixH
MDASQSRTGNEAPPHSRSAIRAREARIKYWRVLIVSVFFAAVIGVNMIIGAAALIDNMQENAKAEVAAVEKRKTGKISRPMLDGVFCRTTVFNNKSGEAQEDKIERCDDGAPVRSLKTDFVWNGKR